MSESCTLKLKARRVTGTPLSFTTTTGTSNDVAPVGTTQAPTDVGAAGVQSSASESVPSGGLTGGGLIGPGVGHGG